MKREKKRAGGWLKFAVVIAGVLAVAVVGIELARRNANQTNTAPRQIQTDAARDFPRELRDADGTVLIIPARPVRIASQTLGTDEILLTICEPERVVALSNFAEDPNYSNIAEKAREIPNRVTLGAEQILQKQPDLIFVASYSRAETVEQLKISKAPVFRFSNFTSLENIKNNIRTVGYATGCDAEAEKLINKMNDELAAVRARIPLNQTPPRVMSFGGGVTAGANTSFNDMARAAGAINVSAENGISGFGKISAEKIAEWQPDYIVAGANFADIETKRQQLLNDPVIKTTKAGKNGNIIIIENRHYLTVTHNVVRGIETLADALYGKPQPNN